MKKGTSRRKSNKGKTDGEPKPESKKKRGRPSHTRTESLDKEAKNVSDEDTRPKSTKRAKNNVTATSSKQRKERLSSQPPEVSQDDLIGMDKWMTVKNWDDLVQQIDTIERDGEKLYVYFTLYGIFQSIFT
jgi:chromobox protein 5